MLTVGNYPPLDVDITAFNEVVKLMCTFYLISIKVLLIASMRMMSLCIKLDKLIRMRQQLSI